jgi:hypothetical protein
MADLEDRELPRAVTNFIFHVPSDATGEDHLLDAEAEADLAARCPRDVVGDWLLGLARYNSEGA